MIEMIVYPAFISSLFVFHFPVGPIEGVGGLPDFVEEQGRIRGVGVDEVEEGAVGLGTAVVAQESADPVAGEEDVAGALDVAKGVECGADVTDGVALTGGVVEPAKQRGGPRLDAAILGDEQGAEEGVEGGRVGRHGAGDEVEAADAIGVRQAGALGADDRVAAVGQAHGERVGKVGVIRLVEERLGAVAPDGVEASEGGW